LRNWSLARTWGTALKIRNVFRIFNTDDCSAASSHSVAALGLVARCRFARIPARRKNDACQTGEQQHTPL